MKEKYIVWINYGSGGWSPTGFETLDEAVKHETYGSEKIITRGAIDWEATAKCPYPDCLKVKYKDCPVHSL